MKVCKLMNEIVSWKRVIVLRINLGNRFSKGRDIKMEIVLSAIIPIVTYFIYCNLFVMAGESPIYAFIPILNTYTLCKIVDALWAFWANIIAIVLMIMAIVAGSPVLLSLMGVAIMAINVIVYIRLLIACRNTPVWAIALIVLEVIEFLI